MYEKINGNETVNISTEDLQTLDNDRTPEGLRKSLLDLTGRNKLLNFKHRNAMSLRIIDELPNQSVEKLLCDKAMKFEPVPDPTEQELIEAGYLEVDEKTGLVSQVLPNPSAQQWASHLDFSTSYEVPIESGNEEKIRASEEQAERFENDVWQDTVNQWLENTYRSRVTGLDIMEECLELPRGQQGVGTGRRISQIMAQAGWKRDDIRPAQKDRDGKRRRVFEWINPRGEYLVK